MERIILIITMLSAFVAADNCIASGSDVPRPRLMSESLYADKDYIKPPGDALVWSKMLLDLKIPGYSPRVDSRTTWRDCNYKNALSTLREIQKQLGKNSPYLKTWAANQDRVLLACEKRSDPDNPPVRPIGKSLPRRAWSDFLYQLGSWHFYRGNYQAALENYQRAEKIIGASQRAVASYMVVRTLAYLNRSEDAYHKIGNILSNPSLREVHDIAKDYRFVIMSNARSFQLDLTPELAMEHLIWLQKIVQTDTDSVLRPEQAFKEQKNAMEQLNMYFPFYAPDSKAVDWWLSDDNPGGARMQAVKTLAPKYPLIDWMQASWAYNVFTYDWLWALHKTDDSYWEQNRNIVLHALEKWKSTNDGVWLQIAIRRVHPQDEMVQDILAAAEPYLDRPWKTETPEYRLWLFDLWTNAIRLRLGRGEVDSAFDHVSAHWGYRDLVYFPEVRGYQHYYHRDDFKSVLDKTMRWFVYTGQFEHARSFLDIIQEQFRYGFTKWRSLLATDLDEAISVAVVPHDLFKNYGNEEVMWQEMLNLLPSRALHSIAVDERVKQANRALISRTLFTRAILLNYDNDQIDRFAALAGILNPAIREQILESVAGHRRDKYVTFLLKMPRFHPAVYLEYAKDSKDKRKEQGPALDAIDVYNHNDNNWWCRFNDEMFQKRIFEAMKIEPLNNSILSFHTDSRPADRPIVNDTEVDQDKKKDQSVSDELSPYLDKQRQLLAQHPYMTMIDRTEIEALKSIPSGPKYLSEAVIKREMEEGPAVSSEEQNERAANLHRAVRTTRYGCYRDGSHGEYSRKAFMLLHQRYESTPWAKATPYWFKGLYCDKDRRPSAGVCD